VVTVDDAHTGRLQLSKPGAYGDQVGMHQFNQRAAHQKVEPDEGD